MPQGLDTPAPRKSTKETTRMLDILCPGYYSKDAEGRDVLHQLLHSMQPVRPGESSCRRPRHPSTVDAGVLFNLTVNDAYLILVLAATLQLRSAEGNLWRKDGFAHATSFLLYVVTHTLSHLLLVK